MIMETIQTSFAAAAAAELSLAIPTRMRGNERASERYKWFFCYFGSVCVHFFWHFRRWAFDFLILSASFYNNNHNNMIFLAARYSFISSPARRIRAVCFSCCCSLSLSLLHYSLCSFFSHFKFFLFIVFHLALFIYSIDLPYLTRSRCLFSSSCSCSGSVWACIWCA